MNVYNYRYLVMIEFEESTIHGKILNVLSKLALSNKPVGKARIASCIASRGKIISFGVNQRKTHPMQAKYAKNPEAIYLHAEIAAIKNALKIIDLHELKKCTIYICRIKWVDERRNQQSYGLAKPCEGCIRAITEFEIPTLVWTTDNFDYSIKKL